jgi:hypothetical protein
MGALQCPLDRTDLLQIGEVGHPLVGRYISNLCSLEVPGSSKSQQLSVLYTCQYQDSISRSGECPNRLSIYVYHSSFDTPRATPSIVPFLAAHAAPLDF